MEFYATTVVDGTIELKFMFDLPYFIGKHIVYVGEGKERSSFEKFAGEYLQAASFEAIVAKTPEEYAVKLTEKDAENTIVVKAPSIPGHSMKTSYTTVTRVFFDCARQLGAKTIGVTGTKGKTTTASLLAHTLKNAGLDGRLCSDEGMPMLESLSQVTNETVLVVELSSYELAELAQSPDAAIITNLHKDRVDYHGSLEAYLEANRNIMRTMNEENALIYNPETEVILHWLAESKVRPMPIDLSEEVDMTKAMLIGDHNKYNYLMVKKAATLFGIAPAACIASLATFEPVRHRLQPVRTVRGITFVDDAIGSTPEATVAGIKALIHNRGPVGCVMLGGVDRDYDYTELVQLLYRVGIPKLVFFPDTGPIIDALIHDVEGYEPDTFEATDMDEAVKWAAENTPSGSICLLSTAAPSTILWRSFEEKGSLFQKAVQELPS